MATGRRPYEASNGAQLAIALECPPPRVAEANPLVPASLAAIIERALDLDPHRRFPSASALESALTRVDLNEEPRSETRVPMLWILGIAATAAAIASAGYLYHGNIATPRSSTIHSIAVLPLVNLSHDGSQEYFVDGLTDGLINSLGRLSGLKVTARTSVMPFKGSTKSVAIIARELQVDAVLEGSANLAKDENGGESVRIAVNLIDPQTQTQIWNATVEEALVSVLSLQNEIARRLADEIHLAVTADERRRLASDQRIDPNAYKLYLLGRQEWNKRSVESLRKAVDYFSQAIARDPNYAAAYAGLSDSYVLLVGDFGVLPRIEGAVQTEAAAERALALDPDLAEAHTSLAFANFFLNWQFAVADTHFRRALAVNPNYATAHHWYGNYLSDMGREDEGLAQIRRALEIDPLSPIISRDVAWPLFFSGRYDEAVSHLAMTLGAHPGYLAAERLMARAYGQKGDTAEAVRRFEELKKRNDSARAKCELAWAYALAGRTDDADRELTAILDGPSPGVYQYDVALVYAALGRREMALDALEAAFSARDPTMVNLKHDPRLDTLRSEPRFKHLQESMNFPTKIGVPKV